MLPRNQPFTPHRHYGNSKLPFKLKGRQDLKDILCRFSASPGETVERTRKMVISFLVGLIEMNKLEHLSSSRLLPGKRRKCREESSSFPRARDAGLVKKTALMGFLRFLAERCED